ncbi:MAG: ABC transporter ATP-binding protein [Candidatus Baltobacteraceae bacterium]
MMSGHGLMWSNMYDPEKPRVRRRIDWRRIRSLFSPYWKQQSLVFVIIVFSAIVGLVPGYMTARIIDSALPHRSFHELTVDVGYILAAAVVSMALGVAQGYFNSMVGEGIMRDLRTSLVSHLHRMPLSFFTATKTGEIMNRVSSDVDNVDGVVTGTLTTIVTNIVMISTTLIAMLIWNWRLALISTIVVPFMVLPLGPVGRKMYDVRKRTREQRDRIESITQETLSISGITLIKSFVREKYERSRFYKVGTQLMDLEIRLAMIGRWFIASVTAMVVVGPAIVWLGGGWLALQGALDVGVIVAFIGYIQGRLYGPAAALVGIQVQIVSALAVFERIFDYLDMKTERYDAPDAIQLGEVRGDIVFQNVSFSYEGRDQILHGISFTIPAGKVAAFVGPSGAGKTTITQLLPRFYNISEGHIFVDGHDIANVGLESLRENIGIVTQETYLFHDTIIANLRYSRPDATLEAIHEAARAANIHDFIETLPQGYETVVGERGHKLSGGERQRLAIARVLLKNPRILILDEATSALDSENEAAIQSALERLMRGRTSMVIAHRLSTVVNADTIFVIDGGHIVESGSHEELLARDGVYARLYRTQFRERIPS